MRVIVTCGPSYEPIDRVRRLTNFSTGRLGLTLAATLAAAGHDVLCLKGETASASVPAPGAVIDSFTTNDDLLRRFKSRAGQADAIFHAAALCDFRVKSLLDAAGTQLCSAKVPTRSGELTLTLEPTTKVLPQLRSHFPTALIVGWKYELEGTHSEVLAKAERQFMEAKNDACVVNGDAWGPGFGFIEPGKPPVPLQGEGALCTHLVHWLSLKT